MTKTDVMGKVLNVNDEVYFVTPAGIKVGKVTKILEVGFYVEYEGQTFVVQSNNIVKTQSVESKKVTTKATKGKGDK